MPLANGISNQLKACDTHFGRDTLREGAFSHSQLSTGLSHNYYAQDFLQIKK